MPRFIEKATKAPAATSFLMGTDANGIDGKYSQEALKDFFTEEEAAARAEADTALSERITAEAAKNSALSHNIPRITPKDITSYYQDGSLWKRLNGTDGYALFEDVYVGDYFKCREYMSGFTGSAGTLVVTENEAALWTDGRYFIQAAAQLEGSTVDDAVRKVKQTVRKMLEEGALKQRTE